MSRLEKFINISGQKTQFFSAASGKLENNWSVESRHFLVWQLDPGTSSYCLSTIMAPDYIPQ